MGLCRWESKPTIRNGCLQLWVWKLVAGIYGCDVLKILSSSSSNSSSWVAKLIDSYHDHYLNEMQNFAFFMHQVILLNEHTESRTIKLGLHLPESCIDMEIISSFSEPGKHKQEFFLGLGKSGHIYAYDDYQIEKYLLQCQSRSTNSLPKEFMVKMPYADSSITIAKFITDNPCLLSFSDEVTYSYLYLCLIFS